MDSKSITTIVRNKVNHRIGGDDAVLFDLVDFELRWERDDSPVRGNLICSGDDAYDRRAERRVVRELDNGNDWAWASVCVVCSVWIDDQEFEGEDWLGQCSYRSFSDFVNANADYYLPDMVGAAFAELKAELENAGVDLAVAVH